MQRIPLRPAAIRALTLVSSLLLSATSLHAQWTNYIECEDYNFEGGHYISDATDGMNGPYAGGAYANKVATRDIDVWVKSNPVGTTAEPYRTDDYLNLPLYTSPELKAIYPGRVDWWRGYFEVSYNWKVSYQEPGEWQNYTRNFQNGVYKITLRAAHATSRINVELGLVTSDPSQPDQTTEKLGMTDGAPTDPARTDNNVFMPFAVLDGLGQPIKIRLNGAQTLRLTQRAYSNLDWLQLVALPDVTVAPPYILSVAPAPGTALSVGNPTPIEATIRQGDNPVDPAKVRLLVNGTDVTSLTTVTITSTGADVFCQGYESSLPHGAFNVQLIYGDTGSPAVMVTNNWSLTAPLISPNALYIESEDYNYDSGKYFSDSANGMGGVYFGGGFVSLSGTPEVDFHIANSAGTSAAYRPDDSDNDGVRFTATEDRERVAWYLGTDFVLDANNEGEWFNYTREFTNAYYAVYARVAQPLSPAADLSLVTSTPTQPSQTTQFLGSLAAGPTADYVTFATAPFTNALGQRLCVRLSGTQTLRLTMRNDVNVNYLVFVPLFASEVPQPVLNLTRAGANAIISWTGIGFKVQSTTSLGGTWTDVAGGASSPVTVPLSGPARFFRLSD